MLVPQGYTLEKRIAVSPRGEVALVRRDADQTRLVLKTYSDADGVAAHERMARERAALRACEGFAAPRVIELPGHAQMLALEHVRGVPLDGWVAEGRSSVRALIAVALQLADVLVRLHEARMIHSDLAPYNVLVEDQAQHPRARLIGFGRALTVGATLGAAARSERVRGALHYIAPEQTGRMNRGLDPRSDLYSLGATLYHVATGGPPFASNDPLALMHAHLARVPASASSLDPRVPETVSRILAKLLEKEPSERYQSARAVRADLRWCQEQLEERGRIASGFVLGRAELPDRPTFPPTLYGRDSVITCLRERYVQAAQGAPRLLMLTGEPGSGKSVLVSALRADLAATNGYVAIGKFDLSRDRPYSGWSGALGSLAQQLLVESNARLESWRSELRAGLGSLARVIVDLVPDLGFVLGDTPPVPVVGPRESQARLALALRRLLTACATREHPLVLFLDDLQWSDAASCTLLADLLTRPPPCALLLLGAYRTLELESPRPFAHCLSRVAQRSISLETITLHPLELRATTAMLADALERSPEDVLPLAQQIQHKTTNAPLFVRQFVDHIHSQGILRFEPGTGWQWDPTALADAEMPDGVVALLVAKLTRLPAAARSVIELASCVGDDFDAELLGELSGQSGDACTQPLFALADAGFIAPCARGFRFVHDRVREAARALLDEDQRARLHHGMARVLLDRLPDEERERRILEVAEHQARALPLLSDQERAPALALQLRAGQRALASGAASNAEVYLGCARTLLHPEDWEARPGVAFDLHLASAASAFLRGDPEAALAHIDEVERHPLSDVQRAQAEAQRLQVLAVTEDPEIVAARALEELRRLGARWPLHPSRLRTRLDLGLLRLELWLRGVDRLFRPAQWVDPARLAILLILAQGAVILGRVDGYVVALITAWATRQNLRHGFIARPAYSLAALAVHGFTIIDKPKLAQRLSTIALAHNRRQRDPLFGPRAEFEAAMLLSPWLMPRREALAPLEGISDAMREVGDLQFANYCDFQRSVFGALAGDPVRVTEAELREQVERVEHEGYHYLEPKCCHQAYHLLVEPEVDRIAFAERIAEGEATMARGKVSAETFARSMWMMVLCIYGRFDLALEQSDAFFARLFRLLVNVHVADHVMYRGLAAAELATGARGRARQHYVGVLRDSLRRLRAWQRQAGGPDLGHMTCLLQAERQRLTRRPDRARRMYDRALEGAERHAYPHHAALAAERRARLLQSLRLESLASLSLAEAARRYRSWGCESKARSLERAMAHSRPH